MMEITDFNGRKIVVTDLHLAILQADDFRHYQLSGSDKTEYNRRQKAYWEDIYFKLRMLDETTAHAKMKENENDNL